jgi:hypothetical protein
MKLPSTVSVPHALGEKPIPAEEASSRGHVGLRGEAANPTYWASTSKYVRPTGRANKKAA